MKKLFGTLILLSLSLMISAQKKTCINREWFSYTGDPVFNPILNPFGAQWSKSIPSGTAGAIIIVAHTNISGQGENILITKYDMYGGMAWQHDYNTSGSHNDYGIDVSEDPTTGDVYLVGTTDNGGSSNYDIVILKYNTTGSLVATQTFTGSAGLNDIGTAITNDGSGHIYVAATNENVSTGYDYLAIALNSTLGITWSNTYDYASLTDVPVGISVYGTKLTIFGASANSLTDWDYASAEFYTASGIYNGDSRDSYPGYGFDQPLAYARDASGNTYLTGKASSDGINYDIRTMVIDNTNTIVWSQIYDANGYEDVGNTIAVDASGNVIVGGYITNTSNGIKEMVVLKYDNSGTLLWHQIQASKDVTADAYIKSISLNWYNDIYYIAGEKGIGANKQALVGKIKSDGTKSWEKSIKGNYDYIPSDVRFGGGGTSGIYTIAIKDSTVNVYETGYYTEFETDTTRVFKNGKPFYKQSEFIVRFNPHYIDTTKINNRDISYGYLNQFLDSAGIAYFNSYTRMETDYLRAYKLFPNLTSRDTMSLSRTGNSVKLLPLYATLVVEFPSSDDSVMLQTLRNSHPFIQAVDLNYYIFLHNANDADYVNGKSAGLDATVTYTASNINASPAWAIETGNPNTIVGVFDSGINSFHADFNTSSSKVTAGYDYYNNLPHLSSLPVDKYGHGTGNAGLIGAIRNNTIGIAGIAGGDATIGNTGVSLNDMKCFEGNDQGGPAPYFAAPLASLEQAMIDGALSSTTANIGQGQHVQNHSWGIENNFTIMYADLYTLRGILTTVFENECLMSFSSGNSEDSTFSTGIHSVVSNMKDEFNLCVGGVGANGGRWHSTTNASNGGEFLDVVAPASSALFNLLSKSGNSTTDTLTWGMPLSTYSQVVEGTSYSAPHAAGVAALMISYINNNSLKPNNIAPEDVEKIMEKNASDITGSPYATGYDAQTGWGRVNAGAAMQNIILPHFQVKHFNVNTTMANCSVTQAATLESIWYPQVWNGLGPIYGQVNKYEVTYTNTHSIGSYTIIDAWKRDAASNLCGNISVPINVGATNTQTNYIPNDVDIKLNSYNNSSAVLKGYVYEILNWNGSAYVPTGYWFPFDTASTNPIKFAYTLHLSDGTLGIKTQSNVKDGAYVYPNPANDKVIVHFDTDQPKKAEIRIMDVMGKLLAIQDVTFANGEKEHEITTSNLINGIYFITLKVDGVKPQTFKQIISH